MFSRFLNQGARSVLNSPVSIVGTVALGTTLGLAVANPSSSLFSPFRQRPISNDSIYADRAYAQQPLQTQPVEPSLTVSQKRGLQRYLNYQQLTIGSMTGAVSGYVVGKLSKAIVVLVVSGYLSLQFLYSRGIPIPGLTYLSQTVVQWGREKLSLRELLLEQPSFKVSFISAFIVGAIYS